MLFTPWTRRWIHTQSSFDPRGRRGDTGEAVEDSLLHLGLSSSSGTSLSNLVHFLTSSVQLCLRLPLSPSPSAPSVVPVRTVTHRVLWWVTWPNHASCPPRHDYKARFLGSVPQALPLGCGRTQWSYLPPRRNQQPGLALCFKCLKPLLQICSQRPTLPYCHERGGNCYHRLTIALLVVIG